MLVGKLKPDDERAQGMVQRPTSDIKAILDEIFEVWDPASEAFFINHGSTIAGALACLPGIVISLRLRKMWGIQKASRFSTSAFLVPSTLPWAYITHALHYEYITNDIILQETDCTVCVDIRSSVIQWCLGFAVPAAFSFFGSCIVASSLDLRSAPRSKEGWMKISRVTFGKLTPYFAGFTLLQLIGSGILVRQEYENRETVLSELNRRFILDQEYRRQQLIMTENK